MSVSQHSMSARVRMRPAYPAARDAGSRPPRVARAPERRARADSGNRRRVEGVAREQAWDPEHLPDLTGRSYLVTGANARSRLLLQRAARARRRPRVHDRSQPEPADGGARRGAPAGAGCRRPHRDAAAGHEQPRARCARPPRRSALAGALDGLLLNAGIVHPPKERETTGDGHEVVFATNVLGHFALAGELLTPLAAASGRMVWLGSMSTSMWKYDPVDPQLVEDYSGVARVRAVQGRHRGARIRGRPPAARGRRAGRERRRAPGVLDERSHARHPRRQRAVAARPVRRQPAVRDHAVQGARRLAARAGARRPGRRGRRVLGAEVRRSAASRARARRPGSLATPRSPRASGACAKTRRACAGRSRRPPGGRAGRSAGR